eukprot:CAMPEP_0175019918 /NCGR_PEP_ID=MMETSP0005-20121125/13837_1 /TAXON_ID=420556 /ORGANISM="Ochromonas sp., Strain CCMP1393" /LENGTH=268 /DNA_ID=CAMNT_0016277731 /DNA_START=88 /DNA_END=896 /DNA_ORIENTATION=-
MPAAFVSSDFMHELTELNLSMIDSVPIIKKSKKRKVGSSPTPLSTRSSHSLAASTDLSNPTFPGFAQGKTDAMGNNSITVELERDKTKGVLSLPGSYGSSLELSEYFPLLSNKKQFQRTIESLDPVEMTVKSDFDIGYVDPVEMTVKSDFDFWLWLGAQSLFAPLSYKTHDCSVVSLQDIGSANILSKWYYPPLSGSDTSSTTEVSAVGIDSTVPAVDDTLVAPALPAPINSTTGSTSTSGQQQYFCDDHQSSEEPSEISIYLKELVR